MSDNKPSINLTHELIIFCMVIAFGFLILAIADLVGGYSSRLGREISISRVNDTSNTDIFFSESINRRSKSKQIARNRITIDKLKRKALFVIFAGYPIVLILRMINSSKKSHVNKDE